jgi:serine/threonine protein kinase
MKDRRSAFLHWHFTREVDRSYSAEDREKADVQAAIRAVVERRLAAAMVDASLGGSATTSTGTGEIESLASATDNDAQSLASPFNASASGRPAFESRTTGPSTEGDSAGRERSAGASGGALQTSRLDKYRNDVALSGIKWIRRRCVGQGAYGSVFAAVNARTGESLAVKEFSIGGRNPQALIRAVRAESDLMRSLRHENIVRGYGIQTTETHVHVLMELLSNGSLDDVLRSGGPLPESVVSACATQILRGLDYLHDRGVLHRDIKPANLLLAQDGTVKLADFGISKLVDKAAATAPVAQSVTLAGTPAYLSPEAVHGRYSVASDLYAVGCTVLTLITGQLPFAEKAFESPTQLLFHVATSGERPALPPVAADLDSSPGHISVALRDFLTCALTGVVSTFDECAERANQQHEQRATARALLAHSWITSVTLEGHAMELCGSAKFELCENGADESDRDSGASTPTRSPDFEALTVQ